MSHAPYDIRQNNERCLMAGVFGTLFVLDVIAFGVCSWFQIQPATVFTGLGAVGLAFITINVWDGRLRD